MVSSSTLLFVVNKIENGHVSKLDGLKKMFLVINQVFLSNKKNLDILQIFDNPCSSYIIIKNRDADSLSVTTMTLEGR